MFKLRLERLRSEANEGMNRSPSVNGTASRVSPAIAPTYQRALRSPPQHLLNSERADSVASGNGTNAPIPRPKSPSECWLQAFKTGESKYDIPKSLLLFRVNLKTS